MGGNGTYLGVNCSRTGFKIGIATESGTLRDLACYPLTACRGGAVVHDLIEAVTDYCARHPKEKLRAAGIGLPGYINPEEGAWMRSLDLGVNTVLPVAALVRERIGVPVWIDNDINAAALAELYFGVGRICGDFLYLGLGEGVAMGIVAGGRLIRGVANCAGEIGHMSVETSGKQCECGYRGCLEGIASVNALLQEAEQLLPLYPNSPLAELYARKQLTAEQILDYAGAGDELAWKVGARAAQAIGTGVVNSMNLLNPGYIILSGPLSKSDWLIEYVKRFVYTNGFVSSIGTLKDLTRSILEPEYIDVLGAACLCMQRREQTGCEGASQ